MAVLSSELSRSHWPGAGRVYVFDPDACGGEGACESPVLQINSPLSGDQNFGLDTATTSAGNILVASQDRVLVFDGSATGTAAAPMRTIDLGEIDGGGTVTAVSATPSNAIVVGVQTGRVFVFDDTESENDLRLTINLPGAVDGNVPVESLAVRGDRVAVGTAGGEGAMVFLFDASGTGNNDAPLLVINNPVSANTAFAETVSVLPSGDVVVGARLDGSGAVYIFDGGATGEIETPTLTLRNPDNFTADGFGNHVVATNSGHIIIGAHVDLLGADAPDAGSAYVFDPNTCDNVVSEESAWPDSAEDDGICEVPDIVIENPNPGQRDHFGRAVGFLADGMVIIGAPQDDTDGVGTGNVFLFEGPAQNDEEDEDEGSDCLRTLRTEIRDPDNLIIVGTSLTQYIRCAGLIPDPPEADRLCFPDCFDDPACHDDGCPFPFISVVIDPLIQEQIQLVLASEVDEARFNDALRSSLASNRTTLTYRPAVEPRKLPSLWPYVVAIAIGVGALALLLARRRERL